MCHSATLLLPRQSTAWQQVVVHLRSLCFHPPRPCELFPIKEQPVSQSHCASASSWEPDSPTRLTASPQLGPLKQSPTLQIYFFYARGEQNTNAAIIWHIYKHWLSLLGEPGTVEPPKTEIISRNLSFICDYMNKWINTTFRDISKKQSHPSLKRDIRNNRGDWTLWRIVSIEISMLLFAA